ncbi:flavodoxin domain-containing protein [Candidatus Peregrinibacteria bacterium]|nr:flavodoxin domain-containing protein [Candidatus Peregrinibacteria bacterium]
MPSLQIIAASTSGHTDYVVTNVTIFLKTKVPNVSVTVIRAEQAKAEDLLKGDVLLLASGTWNTGGSEGQMNPHMHAFLRERAADAKLKGKKVAIIGLGDARYRYTAKAKDLLEEFVKSHGGELLLPSLKIVNEPYGQEEAIKKWAQELAKKISSHA